MILKPTYYKLDNYANFWSNYFFQQPFPNRFPYILHISHNTLMSWFNTDTCNDIANTIDFELRLISIIWENLTFKKKKITRLETRNKTSLYIILKNNNSYKSSPSPAFQTFTKLTLQFIHKFVTMIFDIFMPFCINSFQPGSGWRWWWPHRRKFPWLKKKRVSIEYGYILFLLCYQQ